MKTIQIGYRKIGPGRFPFIIAEMSGNHNQSIERALAIVDAAASSGAHAVKIQTYTADTMTLDVKKKEFFIKDKSILWKGKSLYELYQAAHTPWEWHQPIFDRCKKMGVIGFSTPFDETAVDFLESLRVPCYKIASFELVDIPLIKRVAATGKPLIMSTGMAAKSEIREAVKAARLAGAREIILLKCTSSYPASPEDSNLATLPDMAKRFRCQIGVSDHTLGIGAALAGIALGATVIEKHFTLSRADGGVDSAFSMEPKEMEELVAETNRAWQSIGKSVYGPTEQEKKSLIFRRSLYVARDLKKGRVITREDIRSIRPGLGLPPKYLDKVIGKRIKNDVRRGTPVRWEMLQ
jgi:pseudaminic acid synthase